MAWLLKNDDHEDPEVFDPADEWDPAEWPHAGVWSRDPDGVGRCREHGLTPDQH